MSKKNVNIIYDSGVTEDEAGAIIDGVQEIIPFFYGRRFINYGNKAWSTGDYSSADWYVRHATAVLRHNGSVQLLADSLLDLLEEEPWQKSEPHIDVMFVSQDLTVRDNQGELLNFCFGMARPKKRVTVQSVVRFRTLGPVGKYLSIKALVQHELGHIFGLAMDERRSNTEENLGRHCTNPGCVMRQGLTVDQWAENAVDSMRRGMIYCPQCLVDARKTMI